MASITIRSLDDGLKARLRLRAAGNGRSMEEEVRTILRTTLADDPQAQGNLADAVHRLFASMGGVDLPPLEREILRDPPRFDE